MPSFAAEPSSDDHDPATIIAASECDPDPCQQHSVVERGSYEEPGDRRSFLLTLDHKFFEERTGSIGSMGSREDVICESLRKSASEALSALEWYVDARANKTLSNPREDRPEIHAAYINPLGRIKPIFKMLDEIRCPPEE
ncbi:hypothetical protein LCGC14_0621300 [marine sediment metagenome]|uniref:Uncharacterized protein n=1 Tax=marine sediment metagenome TaxID=412755 RepID=A0A0F9UD93_9ZZZZ